jgi:hypothetical protein
MLYTWDMGTPLSTSPQYTVTTTLRRNNTQISKLKFPYIIKRKLQKQYLNPPQFYTNTYTLLYESWPLYKGTREWSVFHTCTHAINPKFSQSDNKTWYKS